MDFVVFLLFASNAVGFYYLWRKPLVVVHAPNSFGGGQANDASRVY